MLVNELKAKLKTSALGGVYLFAGEEEYLKRHYIGELRSRVLTDPAFDLFNRYSGEGAALDLGALTDAIMSPPMMADYKLIEWVGADFEAMGEKELEAFFSLVGLVSDHPYAILVIRVSAAGLEVGTPKRPSALFRRLAERTFAVSFETPSDASLLSWLNTHLAHEGLSARSDTLRLMIDRIGHSMDILASEVEKIACYCRAHGLHDVTDKLVLTLTCSTAEDDAFGLSNAILQGNLKGAYRKLHDMRRRRVEPILILAQLTRLFSDLTSVSHLLAEGASAKRVAEVMSMNEYKAGLYLKGAKAKDPASLSRLFERCREIDRAAKLGADPNPMLDRLIAEMG